MFRFHKTKLDKSDIPGGWPPEASNIEDIIDEFRKVCPELNKSISNCIASLGIPDADKRVKKIPESKVANTFLEAGDRFNAAKPELKDVYVGIGKASNELAVIRRDFETGVEEKILNHLKKLADHELPEIQKERKTLSKYCVDLKTANERLKSADVSEKMPAEKMQQLRNTQEEAEQRAMQQKDLTLKALFQFDARCRENSLNAVEYLTLMQEYHLRCAEILKTRIPVIQDHIQKSMVSPVFRTPLRQHLQEADCEIAYVLEVCINALNKESALKEEGIFRTAGSKTKVDILTQALDAKRAASLIHECEYSVIADALKQYFRFMEEPLLLSSLFGDWMRAMQQTSQEDRLRALWNVMHTLPDANRVNLRYLIKFLAKVSTYSEHNRMTPANLGIVFGPNLLKPGNTNETLGMMSTGVQSAIVELMITHADWFFPDSANMFAGFTKETETQVTAQTVPIQYSYTNLALESSNGPAAEADSGTADDSPNSGRKHSGLSSLIRTYSMSRFGTRGSFSPTSSGTMSRKKTPAPLPPAGRLSGDDLSAAKSMPSVLAHQGSSSNVGINEDEAGDSSASSNLVDASIKKAATMPSRPASMPPAPIEAGKPPRPKKPSFNAASEPRPKKPSVAPPEVPDASPKKPPRMATGGPKKPSFTPPSAPEPKKPFTPPPATEPKKPSFMPPPAPEPKKPSFSPPAPPAASDSNSETESLSGPPPRPSDPPPELKRSVSEAEPESTHL